MHWILIGIGLIILRLTEPMFGMFLSEISWFVFSGLFIYLGFALNNLQTNIRELQIRQRELLLELKRVSKSTLRAVQTLDYTLAQEAKNSSEAVSWLDTTDTEESLPVNIPHNLHEEEWDGWTSNDPNVVPNIFQEAKAPSPSNSASTPLSPG